MNILLHVRMKCFKVPVIRDIEGTHVTLEMCLRKYNSTTMFFSDAVVLKIFVVGNAQCSGEKCQVSSFIEWQVGVQPMPRCLTEVHRTCTSGLFPRTNQKTSILKPTKLNHWLPSCLERGKLRMTPFFQVLSMQMLNCPVAINGCIRKQE